MNKLLLFSIALFSMPVLYGQTTADLQYSIGFDRSEYNSFEVTLDLGSKLKKDNHLFQFAATAPGTYQVMDIGRFVQNFSAFDKKGREVAVDKTSDNQYVFAKPKKVTRLTYTIAETWDTQIAGPQVYPMSGSSLEADHAMISPHTVMGYIQGLQNRAFSVEFDLPAGWKVGTALPKVGNGYFAENYDLLVDSPFLLGELTYAGTKVAGTEVDIYTYSQNGKVTSAQLLQSMQDMLEATRDFLGKLPVDRYTFLYHFEPNPPQPTGAWEHSYSSGYVLPEKDYQEKDIPALTHIAAHEFFHIVTPLNIHSERIESFNFVDPTPSQHLWLYEGVTEWAANIIQYRAGLSTLDAYLTDLRNKTFIDARYFDQGWSLQKLAMESYTDAGQKQYPNIYMRGALVAGLLDIRLLELSDGSRGLREVLLELIQKYGKSKPISEQNFFADLAAMTYSEIGDFINRYIIQAETLPLQEYYEKVGIQFLPEQRYLYKTMTELTPQQEKLRKAWSQNLPMEKLRTGTP